MADTISSPVAPIESFFNRFVEAFATFDAANVAQLFATPGVALRKDGSIVGLGSRDDVLRYYQAALDHYRRDGCAFCRWTQLKVTPMGLGSTLAAVTWRLLRSDESLLVSWRQSYCLSSTAAGPMIFASAMHRE